MMSGSHVCVCVLEGTSWVELPAPSLPTPSKRSRGCSARKCTLKHSLCFDNVTCTRFFAEVFVMQICAGSSRTAWGEQCYVLDCELPDEEATAHFSLRECCNRLFHAVL